MEERIQTRPPTSSRYAPLAAPTLPATPSRARSPPGVRGLENPGPPQLGSGPLGTWSRASSSTLTPARAPTGSRRLSQMPSHPGLADPAEDPVRIQAAQEDEPTRPGDAGSSADGATGTHRSSGPSPWRAAMIARPRSACRNWGLHPRVFSLSKAPCSTARAVVHAGVPAPLSACSSCTSNATRPRAARPLALMEWEFVRSAPSRTRTARSPSTCGSGWPGRRPMKSERRGVRQSRPASGTAQPTRAGSRRRRSVL